jgi:hypothetical protein
MGDKQLSKKKHMPWFLVSDSSSQGILLAQRVSAVFRRRPRVCGGIKGRAGSLRT